MILPPYGLSFRQGRAELSRSQANGATSAAAEMLPLGVEGASGLMAALLEQGPLDKQASEALKGPSTVGHRATINHVHVYDYGILG